MTDTVLDVIRTEFTHDHEHMARVIKKSSGKVVVDVLPSDGHTHKSNTLLVTEPGPKDKHVHTFSDTATARLRVLHDSLWELLNEE